MVSSIRKINFPEMIFGFVAPVGSDVASTIASFRSAFEAKGYQVIEIKVTNGFKWFSRYIPPTKPLVKTPLGARYDSFIAYGNQLRGLFGDEVLASYAVTRIIQRRARLKRDPSKVYSQTVYLIHQFKRSEEIDLLRSVYGQLFFQVSVYSRHGARISYLSSRFARSRHSAASDDYLADAEALCRQDENERGVEHGQRVGKIFHDADLIVSLDSQTPVNSQVTRFCDLVFSANFISPTRSEYGLYMAKAAALRTLDLSRQVGAAIFSETGEIVALGSNEVPKARGGTYWPDENYDDREFKRDEDSNDARKKELLAEIIEAIDPSASVDDWLNHTSIRDSQFMDALEYGRIVHAEMCAIADAARLGRPTGNAKLYVTTFPCHMCAKHIVAAGISEVIFLEPYPKSLASKLHSDAISFEGRDRGSYQHFPAVDFSHFHGVTPRRYRELFERGKRKKDGKFVRFGSNGTPMPFMDIKNPFYIALEDFVLKDASGALVSVLIDQDGATDIDEQT